MTALHIQDYLRGGGSFASLLSTYAVKTRRHAEHPNLVSFKYDMVDSNFSEPLVRECRGIVLDKADDWRVVARAFDKFFNYGEGHAAPIEWSTARVQEKVDGSLCTLYFYKGAWHVATTGTPDACGDVNGFGILFRDLFWRVLGSEELPSSAEHCCFYFELTGPLNRIVVQYATESLTLLGARDLQTQQELPTSWAATLFPTIRAVREYPLQSFDDITATFDIMSPLSQEGYVVVDGNFNRVKVKHPGYVALHHAKGGMSRKAFVAIAQSGEVSEVVAAFPEFAPMLDDAKARFSSLVSEVESDYERIKDIAEQKAFAFEAVKTRCSAALFAVRAKKVESVRSFFRNYRTENLMPLLGYGVGDDPLPTP